MPSYQDHFHRIRQSLQPLYDAGEAAAIARELLLDKTGRSYSEGLVQSAALGAAASAAIDAALEQLLSGRPLQQVLGYAWFGGRRFAVNEHVLIPRPETEELVDWIVQDCRDGSAPAILDIGAGSGCIGVSLALLLPQARVTAVDVSPAALAVARQNADQLGAAVRLEQLDFLRAADRDRLPLFDLLVSNPPYIPAGEAGSLHPNVRDFEPGTALFVPGDDPQLFYRHIATFAAKHLNPGGAVYCELHRDFAEDTERLFAAAGFATELRKDTNGNWRMVRAW